MFLLPQQFHHLLPLIKGKLSRWLSEPFTLCLVLAAFLFLLVISGIIWVHFGASYLALILSLLGLAGTLRLEKHFPKQEISKESVRHWARALFALGIFTLAFLRFDPVFSRAFHPPQQRFSLAIIKQAETPLFNLSKDKVLRTVPYGARLQVVDEHPQSVLIHYPDQSEQWLALHKKPSKSRGQYWVQRDNVQLEYHYLRYSFAQERVLSWMGMLLFLIGVASYIYSYIPRSNPEADLFYPIRGQNGKRDLPLAKKSKKGGFIHSGYVELKLRSQSEVPSVPKRPNINDIPSPSSSTSASFTRSKQASSSSSSYLNVGASSSSFDTQGRKRYSDTGSGLFAPDPAPLQEEPSVEFFLNQNSQSAPGFQQQSESANGYQGQELQNTQNPEIQSTQSTNPAINKFRAEATSILELLLSPTLSNLDGLIDECERRLPLLINNARNDGISAAESPEVQQIQALILYNRGLNYSVTARWGSAVTLFQRVVDLYSSIPALGKVTSYAAFEGARACFQLSAPDWDQALKFFASCDPSNLDESRQPYYYSFLGEVYYKKSDWVKAEECFHYFSTLNKSGTEMIMIQRAKCLRNMGRYDEAHILLLDSRLHERSEFPKLQSELHYILADILTIQNNIQQAIQAYEKVLSIDPEFKDVAERIRKLKKIQEKNIDLDAHANAELLGPTLSSSFERISCPKCQSHVSSLMINCPFCGASLETGIPPRTR